MSDIIQLLPDTVANQIAAGEVIQRPASVIKELVENAIDAGAKRIDVVVTDAGRTAIQVIDDGKGMSETDARLSFERHATSKIRNADDLFSLQTMGFRGEALASIAAVAQVELLTRQRGDDLGTRLLINGNRFVSQEPESCPEGSNFIVKNLFYNVPVRRKFLKSNATELSNIVQALERIALVYPDIHFTLQSNGNEMLNLRGGNLHQRIIDVFGKRLSQVLLPVEVETSVCRVYGYVAKPEAAKKKGANQFFFVNGRYMKHPYFHKAVLTAFERLLPQGTQPCYFLYFDVEPSNIDVNIHPTKTEIKFENEQAIWQILLGTVKNSLGKFCEINTLDFDTEGRPDIPVFNPDTNSGGVPKINYSPGYNPFKTSSSSKTSASANDWQTLYQGLDSTSGSDANNNSLFSQSSSEMDGNFLNIPSSPSDNSSGPDDTGNDGSVIVESGINTSSALNAHSQSHYQYKGQYIMTSVKSGLMIVNQVRAHIRILFDDYMQQLERSSAMAQKLLFPEMVKLPQSLAVVFPRILPQMEKIGFEIADLGGGSYGINAIPAGLEGVNISDLVTDMATTAVEHDTDDVSLTNSNLCLSLARHAAMPVGEVLDAQQMDSIISRLLVSDNPNYTPDGKIIIAIVQQGEIEKLF